MTVHKFIEDFGFLILSGYSIIILFTYGETTPSDLPPRIRVVDLWVAQTIFVIAMANRFLYHPDKLLPLQLGSLFTLVVAGMAYFKRRETKPKLLRYAALASGVLLVVLGALHSN